MYVENNVRPVKYPNVLTKQLFLLLQTTNLGAREQESARGGGPVSFTDGQAAHGEDWRGRSAE